MSNNVIVNALCKSYNKGKTLAVKEVSFSVAEGELFGLIGPDGAGKSSIFRMLSTLILPDSGSMQVAGLNVLKDYKELRKHIGYMPGKFSLYQDLSVEENLRFFATVFGSDIKKNYDLIKDIYVQIEPFKTRKAGKLSGGMKQKLALCCALIHRPKLLFLDEPTTGVDAVSRKEFWEMLKNLKNHGITILVSTPYMDEATLCERIALIQAGTIMSIDRPDEIRAQFGQELFAVKAGQMSRLLQDLRHFPLIGSCHAFGDYHHITFVAAPNIPELNLYLQSKAHVDIKIEQIDASIEDCFIKFMQ